jgi:hypothetical protein
LGNYAVKFNLKLVTIEKLQAIQVYKFTYDVDLHQTALSGLLVVVSSVLVLKITSGCTGRIQYAISVQLNRMVVTWYGRQIHILGTCSYNSATNQFGYLPTAIGDVAKLQ